MSDQATPQQSRRLKYIIIPPELLLEFMRTGWEPPPGLKCIKGLPLTAQFVGSTFNPNLMLVNLFFSDESFEEIPLGEVVPFAVVTYGTGEK